MIEFHLRLTHPNFSKLSCSEPALQLQGLTGNLPLILPPGLLRCPRLARLRQLCAQPICIAWMTERGDRFEIGQMKTRLHSNQ